MYESTRGNFSTNSAAEVIALGMVPQGGLFVPSGIPRLDWQDYQDYTYSELAAALMKLFLNDIPSEDIDNAVKVYEDGRFSSRNPAPLVSLNDCSVLELWHGPTAAFKDMALQVLPYLLSSSINTLGTEQEVIILTATSGDTGKAALEGFKNVRGTRIIVFYPEGGVSPVQERQMLTTKANNTTVVAVEGNFDQCQSAVKDIFASEKLREELLEHKMVFSSANSINWGRLLPQIVYYFWAYIQAFREGKVKDNEKINIVVPTGNFGNILAAYYAREMGVPIANLICASNDNKVLSDFFETGIYDIQRPFYLTISPSMDILISSNFERYLYEVSGRDGEKVKQWYAQLAATGRFEVDEDVLLACKDGMWAGWCDQQAVKDTIKKVYEDSGYLLDSHTAVAVKVYQDYREKTDDPAFTVIASTASPFKFAQSVLEALTGNEFTGDAWEALEQLNRITGWNIPDCLDNLFEKSASNKLICKPKEIYDYIRDNLF